jgi:lipocalin-like protein
MALRSHCYTRPYRVPSKVGKTLGNANSFQSVCRSLRLVVLASLVACTKVPSPQDRDTPSLIGTWRILRHTSPAGADANTTLTFGSQPRGYLVYDATGHIFLQVQDAATADSVKGRWWDAPDSLVKSLLKGFQAYFGTYSVDSAAQMVTHRIEGELLPRFGSVEVATPYRLRGDSLVLGTDSLEQWHFVRIR